MVPWELQCLGRAAQDSPSNPLPLGRDQFEGATQASPHVQVPWGSAELWLLASVEVISPHGTGVSGGIRAEKELSHPCCPWGQGSGAGQCPGTAGGFSWCFRQRISRPAKLRSSCCCCWQGKGHERWAQSRGTELLHTLREPMLGKNFPPEMSQCQ